MSDSGGDADVQPLVTQCPSCHTQFRVSENQLQVAGGKVRCGACLAVFQGVDNLVWEGAEAPDVDAADSDSPIELDDLLEDIEAAEPAAAGELPGSDSPALVVPETELESEPDEAEALGEVPIEHTATAARVSAGSTAAGTEQAGTNEALEAPDTLVSEQPTAPEVAADSVDPLLATDQEEAFEPPERRPLEISLDELEAQLLSGEKLNLPQTDELAAEFAEEAGAANAATEAAPADDALIPGDELMAVKRRARDEAAGRSTIASVAATSSGPVEIPDDAEGDAAAPMPADDPFAQLRETAAAEADPFERLAAKQREAQAPLPAPGRSSWPKVVGIAVGVLLLTGQVLYLRFGSWTQDPKIRPVYEVVCGVLSCTVPPLKALEFMEVVKKSARSHPTVENALQIDLLIANRATFAQTFPLLEIVFTDFNNEVVAGRRFKPSEYLAGELLGQTEIPAQTPVRVQLEIEDLGEDAVNYNITFR